MPEVPRPSLTNRLICAPLVPPALGLMFGVVLDDRLHPPIIVAALALLLGTVFTWREKRRPWRALVGIFLASIGTGALLHAVRLRHLPQDNIAHHLKDEAQLVRLYGAVASPPRVLPKDNSSLFSAWHYHADRTAFLLDICAMDAVGGKMPASGRVRVNISEAMLDLRESEDVEVFGWLTPLRGPQNPGAFDWASFQRRQGIVAVVRADHRQCVRRLQNPSVPPGPALLNRFRMQVRGWLVDDLVGGAEEEASLLTTMVLGHRSTLDRRINEIFIDSGTMHFLAVSGTHVLMLMAAAWMVGRLLRIPRRWTAWGVLALIMLYALVTEPRPPILRATIIGALYCLSVILLRGHAQLNWLAAAAILLLVVDPASIFDVGFQLSFAAVLGVAYLAPSILSAGRALRAATFPAHPTAALLEPSFLLRAEVRFGERFVLMLRMGMNRLITALAVTLAVSVGAWTLGLPIALFNFQRFQPWGAINSVLVLPLITAVTILGALKVVVAAIFPTLSAALGTIIHFVNQGLLFLIEILAKLPGASCFGPSPPVWWMLTFYALLAAFIWTFPPVWKAFRPHAAPRDTPATKPRRLGKKLVLVSMFGLLAIQTLMTYGPRRVSGQLVVTALAVGAGSATVIELPDGRALLFDAGSSSYPDVGRSTILPFLRQRGIRRLDTVFISHANLDHYNALPDVLAEIPTQRAILTPYFLRDAKEKAPPRRLLDWLAKNKIPWFEQTTGPIKIADDVSFFCHWPPADLDDSWDANETSLTLELSFGGKSILLTGDVEARAQRALIGASGLPSDVLFLPHHGSMSDALDAFVRQVNASVLIRSAREPMRETMTGLGEVAANVPLYNTADVGAILITIEADGALSVETPCKSIDRQP